jgi:5'-3' exonuclease
MMSFLSINGTDVSNLVKSLKVGYETLVSENSGRNANGDTVIDVINKKVKLQVVFRAMEDTEMVKLLGAIEDYVVEVKYRDVKTNSIKTITCYTGTPEPDYYFIHSNRVLYKELNINFIEL